LKRFRITTFFKGKEGRSTIKRAKSIDTLLKNLAFWKTKLVRTAEDKWQVFRGEELVYEITVLPY